MRDSIPSEPTDAPGDWHFIGPHRYRLVGRLFWLETHGPFTAEHTGPFLDELMRLQATRHDIGLFVNAVEGLSLTPECRRMVAMRSQRGQVPMPMAVVGGGLLVRTVFTLLSNALRLFARQEIPMAFFKDEAEALAWLENQATERKKRVLAAQGSVST